MPPPWKCSRPGWTGLWATWSGASCLRAGGGQGSGNRMIFKVRPNSNHSVILRLHSSLGPPKSRKIFTTQTWMSTHVQDYIQLSRVYGGAGTSNLCSIHYLWVWKVYLTFQNFSNRSLSTPSKPVFIDWKVKVWRLYTLNLRPMHPFRPALRELPIFSKRVCKATGD